MRTSSDWVALTGDGGGVKQVCMVSKGTVKHAPVIVQHNADNSIPFNLEITLGIKS